MYIEVLHDITGKIFNCYCADTLPVNSAQAFFRVEGGVPQGIEHARINIDTVDALAIEGACGLKAVVDPVTQVPSIINVERVAYIMSSFKVDTATIVPTPPTVSLPSGVTMRRLLAL